MLKNIFTIIHANYLADALLEAENIFFYRSIYRVNFWIGGKINEM